MRKVLPELVAIVWPEQLASLSQRPITDLRRRVHGHAVRMPAAFFDSKRIAGLVSRVGHDVASIESACESGLVSVAGALLTAVLAFAVLVRRDPALTLASAAFLPLFVVLALVALVRAGGWYRELCAQRSAEDKHRCEKHERRWDEDGGSVEVDPA